MRAVVVQANPENYLAIQEVPDAVAVDGSVLVRVKAFSLNRGEVKRSATRGVQGDRPGSDFAGIVEQAPPGSGFAAGDRVAGMLLSGAWAERAAVPAKMMARIPQGVSFEQAAAIPLAGLTALIALAKKPLGAGSQVLISGATGGVGMIAVQLAAAAGAHVTALVRSQTHAETLTKLGADVVATDMREATAGKAYDLVLDLVGGEFLAHALGSLASRGVCVLAGNAGGAMTTFDANTFRMRDGKPYGGTTLYGFFLGEEIQHAAPSPQIAELLNRMASGSLDPMLGRVKPWTETLAVANALLSRDFAGKAVLSIE